MSIAEVISFDNTEVAFRSKSDKELKRAYRLFKLLSYPWLADKGARLTSALLKSGIPISGLIRNTIYKQFCGGETLEECQKTIDALARSGVYSILDYGVEAKNNEKDFDHTADEMLKEIEFASKNPYVPLISCKLTGLGRFELYEKIQRGDALQPEEEAEFERIRQRLEKVCSKAATHDVSVSVDAEESWIQDPIDELTHEMMRKFNRIRAVVMNTVQLYRKDRLDFLRKSVEEAMANGYFYSIKLVRGAYMEKERARALEMGYSSPIHETKSESDRDFDEAVRYCIAHYEAVSTCVATHNEASCKLFVKLIEDNNLDKKHPHLLCCQLYGMSDHITFNLAEHGFRAAKYVPYGPVKEVLPYLTRRAQENTSVGGQMSRELQLYKKELERRGLL